MEESWARIVAWCERMAPATARKIRPPAEPAALARAEVVPGRTWPAELRQWYRLQNGVEDGAGSYLLPGYRPLSTSELLGSWHMYQQVFAGLIDDGTIPDGVAEMERQPAGTPAWMFLPSYIPIAATNAATELFVDCRPGPLSGCVREYLREDADHRGVRWPFLGAMLEDVAVSLEQRRPTDHWLPTVQDGMLDWEVVDAAGVPLGAAREGSPSEQPDESVRPTLEAEIRSVFARAFTGGQSPEKVLLEVDDWLSLTEALAQARHLQPEITSTSRADVTEVQFRSLTQALVSFTLSWSGGSALSLTGQAVSVDGTWKVARESYCQVLRLAGADC